MVVLCDLTWSGTIRDAAFEIIKYTNVYALTQNNNIQNIMQYVASNHNIIRYDINILLIKIHRHSQRSERAKKTQGQKVLNVLSWAARCVSSGTDIPRIRHLIITDLLYKQRYLYRDI